MSLQNEFNKMTREGRQAELMRLAKEGSLDQICNQLSEPHKTQCKRFLLGHQRLQTTSMNRVFILAPKGQDFEIPLKIHFHGLPEGERGGSVLDKPIQVAAEHAILLFEEYGPSPKRSEHRVKLYEMSEEEYADYIAENRKKTKAKTSK